MLRLIGGEEAANARALAWVWGFGATCLALTIALPHPAGASETGLIGVVVIAYPVAALMFVGAGRLPARALEGFTYLGQLLITLLTFCWGAPEPPFLWFHLWLVVHSFHFLSPGRAIVQIGFAAVLFVFATIATDAPFPAATSVVGVGSLIIIGLLVGALRAQVDELVHALERSAKTDPLTGLANRRGLAEAWAAEQARRRRTGAAGALLLLDCDRLKQLNDRHGHAAGDRALQGVAAAMVANVREIDTPTRIGGDEFALLLSGPDRGRAADVGERIRRAVARDRELFGITLSIGVVELAPDAWLDLDAMLGSADGAMYRSKSHGGDHVSVSAPRPATHAVV